VIELFSDCAEFHDQAVKERGSFERAVAAIEAARRNGSGLRVRIPVNQYTFFNLPRIAAKALELLGSDADLDGVEAVHPRPLLDVEERLDAHVRELGARLRGTPVVLGSVDSRLRKLLSSMALRVRTIDERLLLRVLGLVCNTVFTGPMRLLIDPTPLCNLDCLYCRGHSALREELNRAWKQALKNPYLDFDLFTRIVDDAVDIGVSSILVVGGGDPTVHPKFTEMVEYVGSKGLEFNVSTNGLLLNERIVSAMTQLPAASITVSMSAATAPTFVKLHPRKSEADFERLLDTLRMVSRVREASGRGTLRLKTLFVITQYNLHEIIPFVEMTRDLNFHEVWFQLVHIDPYCDFLQPTVEQKEQIERDLLRANEIAREGGIEINSYVNFQLEHLDEQGTWSRKFFEKHGCNVGWQFTYISYKGEVSFCCGLKVIDTITPERSLKDIWYSHAYNRFRVAAKKIRAPGNAELRFKNDKPLYDAFCDCCDNHNFNEEMINQVVDAGFGAYLEDHDRRRRSVPQLLRGLVRDAVAILSGRGSDS
jgi:MoaA/NifB/PqqE/SkfB family radical SAM enzyme